MVPEAGIEPARKYKFRGILNPLCLPISPLGLGGGAFQSRTGLDEFAIRCITALLTRHTMIYFKWRRVPESDWTRRICNPLHNRFANAPLNNLGAGNEARTRDPNLGKVMLYQLSYSRRRRAYYIYFKN